MQAHPRDTRELLHKQQSQVTTVAQSETALVMRFLFEGLHSLTRPQSAKKSLLLPCKVQIHILNHKQEVIPASREKC